MMMKNSKLKLFLGCLCLLCLCAAVFAQKISDPFAKKYHNPFRKQIEKIIDLEEKLDIYRESGTASTETIKKLKKDLKKEKEKFLKQVKSKKERTQKEIDAAKASIEKAGENAGRARAAQEILEDREKYMRYIDIWARNEDPYELEDPDKADLDSVSFIDKKKSDTKERKKEIREEKKEEKKEAREEAREEKREARKKAQEEKSSKKKDTKEKTSKAKEPEEEEDTSADEETEDSSDSEEMDY